jgi:hypothetical protein
LQGYFKFDDRKVRVQLRNPRDLRDPAQTPPGVCCGTPRLKVQPRLA